MGNGCCRTKGVVIEPTPAADSAVPDMKPSSESPTRPLITETPRHQVEVTVRQSLAPISMPLRLIISGPPACGKGTQCERIVARFGCVHISTGDLLRDATKRGTELGLRAKPFMESGSLVPDELVIGLVRERLAGTDCGERGYLLDGFPRTEAQAVALRDLGVHFDRVLMIEVPDDVLVGRAVGRRLDPVTGKIYNLSGTPQPPADDAALLGRLVHRADDTEDKVRTRLAHYHRNAEPLRTFYAPLIAPVDGTQPIDAVARHIEGVLCAALEAPAPAPAATATAAEPAAPPVA